MQVVLVLFYWMKNILKPIQKLKQSYEKVLSQSKPPNFKSLNLKLLSNPFIKEQDHYKAICSELMAYNKKILDKLITDQYEVYSHERLFSIISDLTHLEAREDMMKRLEQTWKWWVQQRRKIKQRKDLGLVKYKTDRTSDKIKNVIEKMHHSQVIHQHENLPTEIRYNEIFPYEMHFRTSHKQMDLPNRRLSEYKRKIINISDTHIFDSNQTKIPREKVTYPRPKKHIPPQQSIENNPQNTQTQNFPIEQPPNPQSIEAANNLNPQIAVPTQDSNKPVQEEQDLGMGLGQQPGQPQQDGGQEQTPQQDKLAPKNKIYTWSNKQRQEYNQAKTYERPYMFYKGCDNLVERRMQQRTVLKQQYSLKLQRQQKEIINKAHEWATQKQKITKQRQYLLQAKLFKPTYSISYQDPEKKQMLNLADQKRYGFHVPPKPASLPMIELQGRLPYLNQYKPVQKEIRKERLSSLRHKFANILSLRQSVEEPTKVSSMCQVSPRRRDFSMILQQHSPQKQKALQLQQICKIKQSLGKQRININIKTLAQALVPDTQEYKQQQFQSPLKQLPNNPFFVQPKKKKKKK